MGADSQDWQVELVSEGSEDACVDQDCSLDLEV